MSAEQIPETLEKLKVPVDGLKHYGKNPRRGDVDMIADSLGRHGQYKPIVVRTGTMEVLAGNHTLKAAKSLGWANIAATFIDVDDDQAARIVLVDNKTNDAAGYDDEELVALLGTLPDLDGTGFTGEEMDQLLAGVEPEPEQAGEDADLLGDEPANTVSKEGDVWELGPHRLVVGDATAPSVLAKLMGEDKADCMWTDPPYGVEYVGKTKDALKIENDGAAGLADLLAGAFKAAAEVLRPGAPCYVAHADAERMTFEQSLRDAGYVVRQNLIWVKNTMVLGHSDFHYKHEPVLRLVSGEDPAEAEPEEDPAGKGHSPVLYGFTPGGQGRLGRGGPRWFGDHKSTSVFEFPKPPASKEHPTMKPVALVQSMLKNSCRPNGLVLDLFAGSGSTLIAADYQRLRARVVELSPFYADVICARWQRHSGEQPVRDGQSHNFERSDQNGE